MALTLRGVYGSAAPGLALAGEAHLAVVLLVVQHVHQVVEQLPAVPADQDVRVA